jgi:biopolymer transport protein ExbD
MPRFNRHFPSYNATSSADIAFLLLLYFLLSGSLSSGTGFYRRLSPNAPDLQPDNRPTLPERNALTFSLRAGDTVFLKDAPVSLHDVRAIARQFIANPANADDLPEKVDVNFPELGSVAITPHAVIFLEIDSAASYQAYISVLGELVAACKDLREELSQTRFHTSFARLSEAQQSAVISAIPQRIAEKERQGKESRQ